ncbi:MAG: hypothetical protein KDA46_08040 [Parvularculaceae bacterium]|nr:hypothetical protein [Parvularculaceae bacterium]
MTETLILILGADAERPVSWGQYAGARLRRAGRTANVRSLRDAVVIEDEETRIVAVVPGEQVAARVLQSPPRDQNKLKSAARYLLEDELAQAIDDLHVVTLTLGEETAAYAIAKSTLEDWLNALDSTGFRVTTITPDFACLGEVEARTAIVEIEDRVVLRDGLVGFSAEAGLAKALLPRIVQPDEATPVVYGAPRAVGEVLEFPVRREAIAEKAGRMKLFADRIVSGELTPNLLSGEFKRKLMSNLKLAPLKRPAVLAAAFAATFFCVFVAAAFKDSRIAAKYDAAARTMHANAFPGFAGGDIRDHVRTILANSGEAASFLEINQLVSAALQDNSNIAIDRIRYDSTRRQFFFNVRSSSNADIEALRADLQGRGLTASDNGGYRRSGDAWVGEMSVSAR